MRNKWLSITSISGAINRFRKDKIVAIVLWEKDFEIYVQTHVERTKFGFGLDEHYGENRLNEKTFKKLRAYLDRATRIKGELNLDSE